MKRLQLLLAALALIGGLSWGILILWLGIHTTSDSVAYLTAATAFSINGKIWLAPLWPPLYPFSLALLIPLVTYPTKAAAVVSAISLAMLLFCLQRIVWRLTTDFWLAAVVVLFCCGWWELFYILQAAWSEGLYAALVGLHLLFVIRHIQDQRFYDYVAAAITLGLVVLTRYLGYSLVAIFGLYSLWWLAIHQRAKAVTWLKYGTVVVVSNTPLLGWLFFNYSRSGTLHGPRVPTERTLTGNIQILIEVLAEQLVKTPFLLSLLMCSLIGVVLLVRNHKKVPKMAVTAVYILGYLGAYLALLLYATSTVKMDQINPRFLSPILPFFLLLIVVARGGIYGLLTEDEEQSVWLLGGVRVLPIALLATGLMGGLALQTDKFGRWFQSVSKAGWHSSIGFEASTTIDGVNALLRQQLQQQDKLAISILTDPKGGHKGRTMMMRRGVLHGNGLQFIGYRNFVPKQLELEVRLENTPKFIHLWAHPVIRKAADIEPMLRKMRRETGQKQLLLVIQPKVLQKINVPNRDLTEIQYKEFVCSQLPDVGLYVVYSCTRQNEANASSKTVTVDRLSAGDLVITEIMADPVASLDYKGEWIEVYNRLDQAVNIRGLAVGDGKVDRFVIDQDVIIGPRTYAVIAARDNPQQNGGLPRVDYRYIMNNFRLHKIDSVILTVDNTLIDSVTYALGDGFPHAKGAALSLGTLDANSNDNGKNWCQAVQSYGAGDKGTPGSANPPCDGLPLPAERLKTGDLIITEMMVHPQVVPDYKGEWFEIYNATRQTVELQGVEITDSGKERFTIEKSLLVKPSGYIVFAARDKPQENGGLPVVDYRYIVNDFHLHPTDSIILRNSAGIIDAVSYKVGEGFSDKKGAAFSLGTLSAEKNDQPTSWCEAQNRYGDGDQGSPGQANELCP